MISYEPIKPFTMVATNTSKKTPEHQVFFEAIDRAAAKGGSRLKSVCLVTVVCALNAH
jgi:hypothetical protein